MYPLTDYLKKKVFRAARESGVFLASFSCLWLVSSSSVEGGMREGNKGITILRFYGVNYGLRGIVCLSSLPKKKQIEEQEEIEIENKITTKLHYYRQ
jgi:hypothetical protein